MPVRPCSSRSRSIRATTSSGSSSGHRRQPQRAGVLGDQPVRHRMERAAPHALARPRIAAQRRRARGHRRRRPAGEGQQHDPLRLDPGLEQARHPRGQHARLARARTGDHDQRTSAVQHRLELRLVQPLRPVGIAHAFDRRARIRSLTGGSPRGVRLSFVPAGREGPGFIPGRRRLVSEGDSNPLDTARNRWPASTWAEFGSLRLLLGATRRYRCAGSGTCPTQRCGAWPVVFGSRAWPVGWPRWSPRVVKVFAIIPKRLPSTRAALDVRGEERPG